jgi:tetratricopeptide (TPR) repeat protein
LIKAIDERGPAHVVEAANAIPQSTTYSSLSLKSVVTAFLFLFSCALSDRYEMHGCLKDLHMSVATCRLVIDCTPSGDKTLLGRLPILACHLHSRFVRLGQLPDIEEAIAINGRSLRLIPDDHYAKPSFLNNHAAFLCQRFDRLGNMVDIDAAIMVGRRAVELTPDGDPDKPGRLWTLGSSLSERFGRSDDLNDLHAAIDAHRHAVELASDDSSSMPYLLSNLALSLKDRFERLGSDKVDDIDQAVAAARRATKLTPKNLSDRPVFFNSLGITLRSRFIRLGELVDIENSITADRYALDLTPGDHPSKALRLMNLGIALEDRSSRFGELYDIEESIEVKRQATDLTPENHPFMSWRLHSLSLSLKSRFQKLRNQNDIDEAVEVARRAVKSTADGHTNKPMYLNTLSSALTSRFRMLSYAHDIEEACAMISRAVQLMPPNHYNRTRLLRGLGLTWKYWLEHSRSPSHFNSAFRSFLDAVNSPTTQPEQKLYAALDITNLCAKFPELVVSEDMVLQAHQFVLDAIPPFIWLGQSISQRYFQLARHRIGEHTVSAASAALAAGKASLALEWLEEGRSVVWVQLSRLRSPLDELRHAHSNLADELERISTPLHNPTVRIATREAAELTSDDPFSSIPSFVPTDSEHQRHDHVKLAQRYDELLARVRSLDGFENFLRAKKLSELLPACQHGPVAVVNVHESRCDALILCQPGRVVHVPLPDFSLRMAKKMRTSLSQCISGRGERYRDDPDRGVLPRRPEENSFSMNGVLRLLWLRIVRPVLSSIGSDVSFSWIINSWIGLTKDAISSHRAVKTRKYSHT